jgi:bifunctional non-homologous end joining protein LigD
MHLPPCLRIRVPCRRALSRRASPAQPRKRRPARSGCTRSSTTAFRVIARKDGTRVKLYSRPGNDLTDRFPLIVEALARLRTHSCIIDGEAVACGEDGIASFDRIRHHDAGVFLYAFDLVELDGDDLRRDPLAVRKATLASLLARAAPGLRFNEHVDEQDGPLVFQHACKLGLEGIVSKRRNSPYRSGRSPDWIKSKNPSAPAVEAGGRRGLGR